MLIKNWTIPPLQIDFIVKSDFLKYTANRVPYVPNDKHWYTKNNLNSQPQSPFKALAFIFYIAILNGDKFKIFTLQIEYNTNML